METGEEEIVEIKTEEWKNTKFLFSNCRNKYRCVHWERGEKLGRKLVRDGKAKCFRFGHIYTENAYAYLFLSLHVYIKYGQDGSH